MITRRQRIAIVTGAGSAQGIVFAAARRIGAEARRVVVTSTTSVERRPGRRRMERRPDEWT